jgi:hypothetical protein
MRRSLCAALGLFLVALPACQSGKPADLPALKIESVRVGIPAGPDSSRIRGGAWCPVYVTLKAGANPITRDALRLVVKTTDADDTPFRYTRAVPAMQPEERLTVLTYTRPGTSAASVDVQVEAPDGRVAQTFPRFPLNAARDALEPKEPLLVAVGSSTLRPDPAAQIDENDPNAVKQEEEIKTKNLALLESVEQMPDEWFGYEAADVVVLATGKDRFVSQLSKDTTGRLKALVEWVRRGGRLVISVGKHHQEVADLLKNTGLIACDLPPGQPPVTLPLVPRLQAWVNTPIGQPLLKSIEVTVVEPRPGKGVTVLVQEEDKRQKDKAVERPLLLQGSCGLGRVVLITFDVEAPSPFAVWPGRREFWEKLQKELRVRTDPPPKAVGPDPGNLNANPNNPAEASELLAEMQRNLETFDEVPTISFGWVALFTLFYIVLIGPLDYFILKRFLKRLELTWVTFPATVLLVSVTAYLIAYWVKGDDLHIKKVDLVEIDLHDNTATGMTWFALFSPRIQNFTVGVEPAPPWVAPPTDDDLPIRSWTAKPQATPNRPIHSTTVAVFSAPEAGRRAASSALYSQPYDYTDSATGLEKVPIPVWATRSFTASWTAPLPKEKPPVEASLRLPRPGGGEPLPLGEITNNLPVALQSVGLFYHNEWFDLGTLEPGETRSVGELFTGGHKKLRQQWLTSGEELRPKEPAPAPAGRRPRPVQRIDPDEVRSFGLRPVYQLMKDAMFFSAADRTAWLNSGMRPIDQSWRFWRENAPGQDREEVILVARAGPVRGKAEELTAKGVAPSSLWLGRLPGTEARRPALDGFLTQETYVRVYIPVARAADR